jgi:hypothetical protein
MAEAIESDESFEADALRPVEFICRHDPRTESCAIVDDERTGKFRSLEMADQWQAISYFNLNESVPKNIRIHFDTARNLYLYSWFVYRFYPVAEQHVMATLEYALRERFTDFVARYEQRHRSGQKPGLRELLKYAIENNHVRNDGLPGRARWARRRAHARHSMEQVKLMHASGLDELEIDDSEVVVTEDDLNQDWLGTFLRFIPEIRNDYAHGSATLHSSVLHSFEVVAGIVNQLYPLEDGSV